MPYKDANDPSLPGRVKTKNLAYRQQWVAAWNNSFSDCRKKGGDQKACENSAFAIATSAAEKYHGAMSKFDDIRTGSS
jgi:hypothetical protein